MKYITALLIAIVLGCGPAAAQTARIDPLGMVNAASNLRPGLPNYGIAQGSMFIVKGENLGGCPTRWGTVPLPAALNGTGVSITVDGVTVEAPMVYVYCPEGAAGATQLAAIAPSNTPTGTGAITVRGSTAPITIVKAAFGIFTVNTAGSGPAIVQNYVSATSTPTNLLTEAAYPGQAVVLWGTGLGPIAAGDAGTPPAGNVGEPVEVLIGGRKANVFYHGRSPQFPGIDQINFYLPEGLEGCYVPVAVKVKDGDSNVVSNYGTVSIARAGKLCSDPHGFSADELGKLASGAVTFGRVTLARRSVKLDSGTVTAASSTDTATAIFSEFIPSQLVAAQLPFETTTIGTCTVLTYTGAAAVVEDPVKPRGLDAGAALAVTGPKGQRAVAGNAQIPGVYSATLGGGSNPFGTVPLFLDPGTYTVTGPGGTGIGPFLLSMNIPGPLTWTNKDGVAAIPRSQELTVTWSGGANTVVAIIGASAAENEVGASFVCAERAEAGQFTVPTDVLMSLPRSDTVRNLSTGYLGLATVEKPARFQAAGCDICTAGYSFSESKTVSFQ